MSTHYTRWGEELWGAVNVEERLPDAFDDDDARLVQTVADQIGSALRSAMLYERLEGAYLGTAEALAAALEAKDSYTASHSRAVVGRTQEVGRRLSMAEPDLQTLRFAAIFHDIGKIAVPEHILEKPAPLNEAEWSFVRQHPRIGQLIIDESGGLREAGKIILHHHERFSGHGYPHGLRGREIPLGSRIVAIAAAYDAMIRDRPYKSAISHDQALSELRRCSGTQFDPDLVAVFLLRFADVAPIPDSGLLTIRPTTLALPSARRRKRISA